MLINLAIKSIDFFDENTIIMKQSDSNGSVQEHKKSIEDLSPDLASYQHQIRTIERTIDNKKKHDYLDFSNREVIDLCFEADKLRQRKLKKVNQAKRLIKKLAETNLGEKGDLYNRVVTKVINENIDSALLQFEDSKLDKVNSEETLNGKAKVDLLLLRASLLRVQNKFDEAARIYEKALKLYPDFEFTLEVANFFMFLKNSTKAEHYYSISLKEAKTDSERIVSLHNLAISLQSNYYFKEAENLLIQALQLAEKLRETESKVDLSKLGMLLNTIGNFWVEQNAFSKADEYYQEALQIRRQLASDNSEMYLFHLTETLNNLGGLNRDLKKYNEARVFYNESLGIIEKLLKVENDKFIFEFAKLQGSYAILESRDNNPFKAEELYLKSLETFHKLPEVILKAQKSFKAKTLRNLSVLYNNIGESDKAQQFLQIALKIYVELAENEPRRYMPNVANALHSLGINFTAIREFTKAENSFKEALEIRKKFAELAPGKFEIFLASTYLCLGELYSFDGLNNEKLFQQYVTNSIELFEKYSESSLAKEWKDKAETVLEIQNSKKDRAELISDIKEAIEEIKLIKAGKKQARDVEEFLNEL